MERRVLQACFRGLPHVQFAYTGVMQAKTIPVGACCAGPACWATLSVALCTMHMRAAVPNDGSLLSSSFVSFGEMGIHRRDPMQVSGGESSELTLTR